MPSKIWLISGTRKSTSYALRQASFSVVLNRFKEKILLQVIDPFVVADMLNHIWTWTQGNLLMTQIICDRLLDYPDSISATNVIAVVDAIVEDAIINDWRTNSAGESLQTICDALFEYQNTESLLILYAQVLQRGVIAATKSSKHAALLASGLAVLEDNCLKVANPIYTRVFDLDWIEQQLPGLNSSAIVARSQLANTHPSSSSKQYSKMMVFACGIAVVVSAGAMHYSQELKGSRLDLTAAPAVSSKASVHETAPLRPAPLPAEEAIIASTEQTTVSSAPINTVSSPVSTRLYAATNASVTDAIAEAKLFDVGMENAQHGHWLPMLRQFCAISPSSAHFIAAEHQLEHLFELHDSDLKVAQSSLIAEGVKSCPVLEAMYPSNQLEAETPKPLSDS